MDTTNDDYDNAPWPKKILYVTIGCPICVFIGLYFALKWVAKGLWWLLRAIGRYLYDLSQDTSGPAYGDPYSCSPPPPQPLRREIHVTLGTVNPMYDPAKNPWYYYDQTDPAGFARSAAFGHHRDRRG